MRGDVSIPCLASIVLLLRRRTPGCGRFVYSWDASIRYLTSLVRVFFASRLARPRINKKRSYLPPALCVRGRVCPISCPSHLALNEKKPCLRPTPFGGRVRPLSYFLRLLIRNPTCDHPVYPRGCVRPLSYFPRLLINKKGTYPRSPACARGRIYPLSCLSRPLTRREPTCDRPS